MRPITATFLIWVLAVSAQQTPPPARRAAQPAQQQQSNTPQQDSSKGLYKIETTVNLVVETVIVKDKSGNPIEGLTAKDFIVTEDGKPQNINFCEFQKLEETIAPAAPPEPKALIAERPPETPAVKPVAAVQISPEKPGDIKYKDKRLMVLFFDMTSMPIQDQFRAQDAAVKFVRTQITPSDLVAIMSFSSDVKVVEDFTDDRDLLVKDIKKLTIGEGQGFEVTNSDDASADTGAAFTADDSEFNIFNTDRQLSALETAAKMLAPLNEKKALVYFASGMQKNGLDNQAQLRATINAAIRSNVSFYPIDARGLVASAPLGDATKSSPGGSGMYSGSSARSAQSSFQGQQETLFTLASDTGGKALLDNNDLSMGIVQAQKDISSYYIIGYVTSNGALDGHFRRVKIAIKNNELMAKVGKFEYRQGYWAGKDYSKFSSTDKERQLAEALVMGDPLTDIDIKLEVGYFRLARDRYFVPIAAKIPGSALELAKHGGTESARLDFIGVVKDAKGATVGNVRDFAEVKMKGMTASELAKHPVAYDTGFALPPGNYTIRFLARDSETGRIGTYDQKFTIPDLSADQKSLPISSVVLSSQRIDLSQAAFNAETNKKLLESNPLIEGGKKLVPSVTRVFNKNQDMYVYLQAYEPSADTTQPLIANVSFIRGKTKAFETAPLQVTEGLDPKSKALPLRFEVPLSKLQPGKYTCQVTVLDPNGQKFAVWRSSIAVMQ